MRLARWNSGLLALVIASAGCSSVTIDQFEASWTVGDYPAAEAVIDELIAKHGSAPLEEVTATHALGSSISTSRKNTYLYMLEKGMCRLARGDHDSALDLWRRSRDELDDKLAATDLGGYFGAILTDDRALDYVGADYEHIVVRTMIAIADLLAGGEDSFAYAFQIGEKQEELADSDFGDHYDDDGNYVGYNPRESYRRVPIGKYLEGVILETERSFDEAEKAYRSAAEMAAGSAIAEEGVRRSSGELRGGQGAGSVHVFYLAGSGPALVETTSPVTDLALSLAQIGAILGDLDVGVIGQTPIPVPGVLPRIVGVPPLRVRADDGQTVTTETLLDVNGIATEQLEANMPWIVARAALRRAFKATAANKASKGIKDDGVRDLMKILANLIWTATESADLRHWTSLPAEFQATHLYLEEGQRELDLGPGMQVPVRVRAGYSSFVVVIQPNLGLPGAVLVDDFSSVDVLQVEVVPEAEPGPIPTP